jgi:hypothetical protein
MSTISKKRCRSEQEWRSLIEAYQQSALSKAAFCKAHRLSRSNFYIWERYFCSAEKDRKPSTASAFIPVSITDTGATTAKAQVIAPDDRIKSALQLSNNKGLRLLFSNGCSYGELQNVMKILQNAA